MAEQKSVITPAPNSGITLPILHSWLIEAQGALGVARAEIDALNVFPVPDGDTGTNLYLTVEAACTALGEPDGDLAQAAQRVGKAAILGARGNSGVIFSALLRDLTSELATSPENLARALSQGARGAYQAVAVPMEGTILTVASRAAQEAARVTAQGADLVEVANAAANAAYTSLLQTPELLSVLRDAGVVDAGGRGLVAVLDALVTVLTGEAPRRVEHAVRPNGEFAPLAVSSELHGPDVECEVMYHFEAPDSAQLQKELDGIGTSVTIAGIDSLWKVHVHSALGRVSDCINAGLMLGVVTQVSVAPLELHRGSHIRSHRSRILLAVTHGEGVRRLLESLGVLCVAAPAREQASAEDIIESINGNEAKEIVILPADRDTHPVADIAASHLRSMGHRVSVIPSRAIPQSLAAIAVHDPRLDFDQDVVAMTRAAGATRYGAITQATRDVLTMAGACNSGDYLGLIDGEISAIDSDLVASSRNVLRRMLAPGAELLTIVTGADVTDAQTESLLAWIKTGYPLIECEFFSGEQPLWPLIFGVE